MSTCTSINLKKKGCEKMGITLRRVSYQIRDYLFPNFWEIRSFLRNYLRIETTTVRSDLGLTFHATKTIAYVQRGH